MFAFVYVCYFELIYMMMMEMSIIACQNEMINGKGVLRSPTISFTVFFYSVVVVFFCYCFCTNGTQKYLKFIGKKTETFLHQHIKSIKSFFFFTLSSIFIFNVVRYKIHHSFQLLTQISFYRSDA